MMQARRRAPGGGRKPANPLAPNTSQITVRLPDDMRAQLKAAADDNGRTLTDELQDRLSRSFERDRELDRDPASYSLSYLLGRVINTAAATTVGKWRDSPYVWETVRIAFDEIMRNYAPPGEIGLPDRPGYGDTPEQTAKFIVATIGLQLIAPDLAIPDDQEHTKFGMRDAVRNLKIETRVIETKVFKEGE